MTDAGTKERDALVPGVHRVIRLLDPTEGPYGGALVAEGEAVAVRVDAASLSGWWGWRHAASEHVAGPVDLVRRVDGHDVLLPWCTERVTGFLGRRATAGAALSAGEVSTLVASLLRGIDEVGAEAPDGEQRGAVSGGWWLTADGRPLFVLGEGAGEDVRAAALQIISVLHHDCEDRVLGRALTLVAEGLRQAADRPRIPRALLDRWEGEFFEIAAPRPLRRDVHAPERARDIAVARSAREQTGRAAAEETRQTRRGSTRATPNRDPGVSRAVGFGRIGAGARPPRIGLSPVRLASAATRLMSAGSDLPARMRRAPTARAASRLPASRAAARPRRRMLVVAGAAAAAVLAGGLLWPAGGESEAGAASGGHVVGSGTRDVGGGTGTDAVTEAGAQEVGSSDAVDAASASIDGASDRAAAQRRSEDPRDAGETAAPDADPVTAAAALLETIERCAERGDAVCAAAAAVGSTAVVEALADVDEPLIALVDEYGDVAVVRLSTDGAAEEKMLVLVRVNEKWLVRDVYGVADQPG